MQPVLHEQAYGFVSVSGISPTTKPFAVINEGESTTIVDQTTALNDAGFGVAVEWARITLQVHSALEAVGLTAAFATTLGNHGISANVIAGYHHDHIFVQWDKRHKAMEALHQLINQQDQDEDT